MDQGTIPACRRAAAEGGGSRPYRGVRAGNSSLAHRHRHRRLSHRPADLPGAGGGRPEVPQHLIGAGGGSGGLKSRRLSAIPDVDWRP
ncbi:hypothetical protein MTBSS4_10425 [Magnetospirillum sp. SS-4]|nr:hypothetical protein MTBSS4_10425 [Magnetospirillum sp. SS-4]